MKFNRIIVIANLTIVALLAAASTTVAESTTTASTNTTVKAAVKHHTPPAVKVTLEDLKKRPKTKLKIAKTDTVLHVADLHCKHCASNISSKMYTVKGVVKVRSDLKADVVIVTPQSKKKIDPMALWKAADKSGFPALKLEGPEGTYVRDAKTKKVVRLAEKKPAPAKS